MSTTAVVPNQKQLTLDQVIARHRQLVFDREYQPLGVLDFLYVLRGSKTLQIDYRKEGPKLAWNPDTGDLLLTTTWTGQLPDLRLPEGQKPCDSCNATCPGCKGTGKSPCVIAGCGGLGMIMTKLKLCPTCLGSEAAGNKTNPDCPECKGRGEVPDPIKCEGCDEYGMAKCARCKGEGRISTGRKNGSTDFDDPKCQECNGEGKVVKTAPQDWRQFVHGTLPVTFPGVPGTTPGQTINMIALGPIARVAYHTTGVGGRFQSFNIRPDAGGNLLVLLLESEQSGSRQYLIGGVPEL